MPLFGFHNSARTPEEADAIPIRRRSTTISMMEEEFGIRAPPRAGGRFGIPSKLRILPPKRRHSSTQAPEPRRSSFLTGSWETVWDCDAEGSYLVESPPDEDADGLLDGALGGEMQGEKLDEVTTPTSDASWSTDEDATPLFSSNFPRQLDHRDLWDEGKIIEEPTTVEDDQE